MIGISWSRQALRDLRVAFDYMALIDQQRAIDDDRLIRASVDLLADFPNRGRPGRRVGTRELLINGLPYLVVYSVKINRISVVRVLHTSQNQSGRN